MLFSESYESLSSSKSNAPKLQEFKAPRYYGLPDPRTEFDPADLQVQLIDMKILAKGMLQEAASMSTVDRERFKKWLLRQIEQF